MITVQAALSGLLLGGLYALMAAGVSVTWGVLRVINLAHFGMMLLGAYLTFETRHRVGRRPAASRWWSRVPAMFVLGGARCSGPSTPCSITELNSLLVSFGLLIIIVQAVSNIWSADFQRMAADVNPYATEAVHIGRFVFPVPTLLAFGVAILVIGGAHLVLRRTFVGRAPAGVRRGPYRSPPRSASTTAGSACCWPRSPARPPRSPGCSSRSATR